MKKKNKKSAAPQPAKQPVAGANPEQELRPQTPDAPRQEAQQPAALTRPARLTGEERYPVILFGVLAFFAMTLQTGRMSVLLPILAVCLCLRKKYRENFVQNLSVPVLGLFGFALMTGLGAIYTAFGESGAAELYKFMASFSVAVVFLCLFEKKHTRALLYTVVCVCSLIALISVDGAGGGFLFEAFHAVIRTLGGSYAGADLLLEGPRVNGIYNDANITANIFGMSALVALYLMRSEESKRGRLLASLPLGISAMGFFLSMSRGSILFFALSLLVWMIAEPAKNRIGLFITMVWCAVVVIGFSMPAMVTIENTSLPAVALCLLAGPVICLLDEAVGRKLAAVLNAHTKAAVAALLALVLLGGGYVAAALNVHTAYDLPANTSLWRSVELGAGSYEVRVEAEDDVTLRVQIQDRLQYLNNKSDILYDGPAAGAQFTIPAQRDGDRVSIRIRCEEDTVVHAVTVSDGTEVPLRYPLLPVAIANRLQEGFFSSSSFILRAQFAKDALALFAQSPIYGHGMGSTENLYTTVQPYFYESVFAHSHVLQVMSDLGVLGTIPFLALLLGSLWLILKQVRRREDAMAAMLLGVWTMMNGHSMMEINFSIRAYQCVAWLLLLLPVLAYAQPMPVRKLKKLGSAAVCFVCAFLLVFTGLIASRRATLREYDRLQMESADQFMTTMQKFTGRDVFDHEQYQLNFVANAPRFEDGRYHATMLKYVTQLRQSGTYSACSGLARHYYLPQGQLDEMFEVSRMAIAQEAANKDAWNFQFNFYREEVLPVMTGEQAEAFLKGVAGTMEYLEQFSQGRMEAIELTEENQAFTAAVLSAGPAYAAPEKTLQQLQEQFAVNEQ